MRTEKFKRRSQVGISAKRRTKISIPRTYQYTKYTLESLLSCNGSSFHVDITSVAKEYNKYFFDKNTFCSVLKIIFFIRIF